MANQYGAINLSQGFPDFDPPEEILAALEKATRGPHHQYAVTWGAPRFREALARKIQRFTGLPIDPDQHLVVTCDSLSKTYSITGWRLGYVQAAPAVIAQARKVHDFLTVGAAAPLQEAAIAGLELPDSYYTGHGTRGGMAS